MGFGFLGEQEAESIYARFNAIRITTQILCHIRLKAILNQPHNVPLLLLLAIGAGNGQIKWFATDTTDSSAC